jgi:hypothetical protein
VKPLIFLANLTRTLVTRPLDAWAVDSQQLARRNALLATTSLTQRRVERAEIESFVDAAAARHELRVSRADNVIALA